MSIWELLLIAVGLSMDAFAVAVCLGLSIPAATVTKSLIVGLYFGVFQGGMPLIGYLLGTRFADKIRAFDHWIAFILLLLIGGKMLLESLSKKEAELKKDNGDPLRPSKLLPLAVATSIDALAVGISFAFLEVNMAQAFLAIGLITFALSAGGVKIGNLFGIRFKAKAELAGGIILMLMGLKILLEHLEIIRF